MAQESFNLSEPLTPNQVQTAHEIKDTPGSSDFYTPECTSNNSKVCITCPLKRVTFQRIIHSTPLKTNKRASAPINSMFPAKYRRKMQRNIPSHQVPNKSPEWNRRDSLRPRISVLSVHTSTCAAKPKKPGNKTISGQCTYKCDECPRSFLTQRGLKIHLSVHRKEAQANTNTTTTIWLRSALQKERSWKEMRL